MCKYCRIYLMKHDNLYLKEPYFVFLICLDTVCSSCGTESTEHILIFPHNAFQFWIISLKALRREREMLSRLMYKRFSEEERNRIYEKWNITLDSKRRRLQLIQRLWSDTKDMNHIMDSAVIVARLVRFSEQGQAPKEMFGLTFTPPRMMRRSSFGWKQSTAPLY